MRKAKIIAYCLILCGLLFLGWAGVSAGDSRANYQSVDSWYSVVYPNQELELSSNCLVPGGQTVLLGGMELAEKEVPFLLRSNGVASGRFLITPEDETYLTAQLVVDGEVYDGGNFSMDAQGMEVVLRLIPTQAALETVHEAVDVRVTVVFIGERELSGTFLVTLPENTYVPEPTVPETLPEETGAATEPSLPEETEPATEETEPAEQETTMPVTDEPAPMTETEPSTEPATTPTEPTTEPTTAPTEPSTEPTTTPTEPTTEHTTAPTEPSTEPTTTPTEPSTEPSTEPTTVPTEPAQPESPVGVSGVGAYVPGYPIPMNVTIPQETEHLTMALTNQGAIEPMPAFTRYSPDGGVSWFLLYYGGVIDLPCSGYTEVRMILDFDEVLQPMPESMGVCAVAYAGGESLGAAELPIIRETMPELKPGVLTERNTFSLALPVAWRECPMTVTVFRLTESKQTVDNGDGTTTSRIVREYVEVPLSAETLVVEHSTGTAEAPENKLTLRTGKPREGELLWQTLPAGTYRVSLRWSWQEKEFADEHITFFINYSPDVPTEKEG